MKIHRRFTTPGSDVFSTVKWVTRTSRITNSDGSLVFEMQDAEVPERWSQLATDIMVSKYFRKAGVPQYDADGRAIRDDDGTPVTGPERSARQVIHRLAGCWRHWGESHGYFDSADDAQAFYDEMSWMLLTQAAAPNSPQWFNTGLNWAYGISGPAQGHWVTDPHTGEQREADDAYSHPQPHACFIQSVDDDLVNPGGIMDLWTREARLFKYGSGTGANFSQVRGEQEPLSGGGKSSGLMSFLKIGDRAAGAIKSGGTTRRAAKMVCLDVNHPDIEEFVNWKVREELKVAAMVEGMKHLPKEQRDLAGKLDLKLDYDFNGEAYYTVSGQNSNNSVRLTDDFFRAVDEDRDWDLIGRTDGSVIKTVKARDLWEQISFAAWRCADPGIQYDSTINHWHTCPNSGRINASNPCSEYMFLDNTACNLASINLLKFYNDETRVFDVERFEHAIELWTIVLEISVLMAAFPSKEIAELSYKFRTLGLGFANLGALLMRAGIPYDSDEGRAICGSISAIMTGRSYAASALMAAEHGPFAGYQENREPMMRVIRNHRRAAHGVDRERGDYEALPVRPIPIDHAVLTGGAIPIANIDAIRSRATQAWDDALGWGERYGFRNAQVSVIAPTGTIGLLMDCDTTGVEPDFALVKFKKLAGGGYFKIANASMAPALSALGYSDEETTDIVNAVMGMQNLDVAMPNATGTLSDFLRAKGYSPDDINVVKDQLPSVFELGFAFTAWSMPESVLAELGIDPDLARNDPAFNGLRALGLDDATVAELNRIICGTQTVEGAPHLRGEHLPVFDCANRCGPTGERFIAPGGHIRMMAAAQPFISGAISKTINLPAEATIEDVAASYRLSWELGLKANALYRDGSKLSQPLSSRSDSDEEDDNDVSATEIEVTDREAEQLLADAGDDVESGLDAARDEVADAVSNAADLIARGPMPQATEPLVERIVEERIIERPMRRRLPDTRASVTHRFNVAGHEGYLTVGLYDDGRPGELFITMSKEGSTIGGLMDSLGTAISVALQYGVPVESLVTKFAHQRFEPMGVTTNRDIPFAKSLVDYIFRWLGMEFVPGYREENAPRRKGLSTPAADKPTTSTAAEDRAASNDRVTEDDEWSDTETKEGSGGMPGPSAKSDHPSSSAAAPRNSREKTDDLKSVTSMLSATDAAVDPLSASNAALQADAPPCDVCGSITVRNGTCYKCMNCGNSMGCS